MYIFFYGCYCCCSVAQSCLHATPWTAAHQASLSFTISQNFLKLMPIDLVIPFNHLILYHLLLLLSSTFPNIRVFSSESAFCIRWPKYWSFSFSISPSSEFSWLITFRIDWFKLLLSKRFSRVFSSTTVRRDKFFGAQPFLLSSFPICT